MAFKHLLTASIVATMSAASWGAVTPPESLDGVSMAMEYRADNGDMFTNVKVDNITFRHERNTDAGTTLYRLEGMLGWYNKLYLLDAPLVEYDASQGLLFLHPGQPVIERDEINWQVYNMVDDYDMNAMPVIFRMDDEGIFRHVSSGKINNESVQSTGIVLGSYTEPDPETQEVDVLMLYILLNPKIHPYNGEMTYSFVAQNGKEFSQASKIYSYTEGRNLIIRNWSDTGFDYNVFFTIDAQNKTVTATNQPILFDPDMLGECVLGSATADGQPIYADGNALRLEGTFTTEVIDGKSQSVIKFPIWGCFNDRGTNFFVPTTNTIVYPGYDITDSTSVATPAVTTGEPVYYNLQGIRVDNPSNGIFICRRGNTAYKVIR